MSDYQLKVRDRNLPQFISETEYLAMQPALREKYQKCPVYYTQTNSIKKAFVENEDVELQQTRLDDNQKYEDWNRNEL